MIMYPNGAIVKEAEDRIKTLREIIREKEDAYNDPERYDKLSALKYAIFCIKQYDLMCKEEANK